MMFSIIVPPRLWELDYRIFILLGDSPGFTLIAGALGQLSHPVRILGQI
jgi:hypothetical protein